jgi:cob(I)alamin adenosyltransferase
MGHRLSRIVTRTGDDGTTGLADGSRLPKDSALIEAIGTVDELNSAVGMAESQLPAVDGLSDLRESLITVQHDLFDLGGALCIPGSPMLSADYAARLEGLVEAWNADLPMLNEFILPGGSPAISSLHLARTICRRAERRLLSATTGDRAAASFGIAYLNRLSDLLFVAARLAARAEGKPERYWQPGRIRS